MGEEYTITEVILEHIKPLRRGVSEAKARRQVDRAISDISAAAAKENRSRPTSSEVKLLQALSSVDVAVKELRAQKPDSDFWRIFADVAGRREASRLFTNLIEAALISGSILQSEKPAWISDYGERSVFNSRYHCAARAYFLIESLSKNPPRGTAEGAYRSITSLLYSVIREQDMKRDCDRWLRFVRRPGGSFTFGRIVTSLEDSVKLAEDKLEESIKLLEEYNKSLK